MKPQTLNDIFFAIVERGLPRLMLVHVGGAWAPISAAEFYRKTAGMARALRRCGLRKGDRLAILSENRPEWAIADFATLLLGAVVVPIYATLTAQQTADILRDSGARIAVVSTEKQLEKVLLMKQQTAVEQFVVMDQVQTLDAMQMRGLMEDGGEERDLELDDSAREVAPDDPASIIYTSGTTGTAKGVQLTHGNFASNLSCSLDGYDVHPGQTSISFLPLSHVTARHLDFAMLYRGVTLAYCPVIDQLPQTLMEVRPDIFVSVPRVYEKIHAQVEQKAQGFPKESIYRWALSVGRKHRNTILGGMLPRSINWKLADKLVYSKVCARLGGKVEIFVSGGAPLGKELAAWYADMGIRIHEGYGLTETSPVIAINTPRAHKMGSVGRPLRNVEVKIADDGEILVRGPSVFRAYWNRPEESRIAFEDGWFKTGDIGSMDEAGYLCITDRKKDLLKTSGGKFIAPQPIENSLNLHALVANSVVLGDRRKFASVIISPQFTQLEDWARSNQLLFSTREELVADPKVLQLYEGIVGEVNRNLARHETLKKILLVPDEFTADDGTLTPTLKTRRRAIEVRYRKLIGELYEEGHRPDA